MQVTGIITEYNPFHNGHRYQIREIRKQRPDTRIIAVMSGSFTQRGEAALLDKWQRAELAIQGGCDLVLELPFVFACRSAQDFARGGVRLLRQLGIVDTLAFGAESDSLTALQACAAAIDDECLQDQLHAAIAQGKSYAAALTSCTAERTELDAAILHQPNNILAIEYLRCLQQCADSNENRLQPLLIPRTGADYHDTTLRTDTASASAIRQSLQKIAGLSHESSPLAAQLPAAERLAMQTALPVASYAAIQQLTARDLPQMEQLWLPLRSLLLRTNLPELRQIHGINEGLENRLLDHSSCATGYADLIRTVTTKRYPSSRISRTLLYLLLNVQADDIRAFDQAGPLYARLLAVGPQGRPLLRQIKEHSRIPLITKTSPYLTTTKRREGMLSLTPCQRMLAYDTIATELRHLCQPQPDSRNDFQQSPLFLQQ
jgi:predicted nucleotidyltransferase